MSFIAYIWHINGEDKITHIKEFHTKKLKFNFEMNNDSFYSYLLE